MKFDIQPSAHELLRALEAPIHNHVIRKEVGHGALDYEVYVQTKKLLALQTQADELVVPEELLFQVMHQSQELWLKVLAFEGVPLVDALDRDDLDAAQGTLHRMVTIARCLGAEMRILQTLGPGTFQIIRRQLGNGSGLESPGYNQLHVAAQHAKDALHRALGRQGTTLLEVYSRQTQWQALYNVLERFVDLDEAHQAWLFSHLALVRRTIGIDKQVRALDGFPTAALPARAQRALFPELWDVRVEMTQSWNREGGFAPGEARRESLASGTTLAAPAVDEKTAGG
jgi:tryptophan 2,3-dioxygenase